MTSTAATIDVLLRANTAAYRTEMVNAARVANQNLGQIRKEAAQTAVAISNLNKAAVAFVGFQSIRAGVSALVEARKEFEALHNSMIGATGSSALADDAYSYVSQTAKQLGLDIKTAAEGFTQLTASATPNGVAMRTQEELFTALSKAATTSHLSTEKVSRAITALSQSFSKSKFQAEELRGQLAEALPGVVPRFQQAVLKMTASTSLAGKSFDQLLQNGLLDAKTFAPAMIEALNGMATGWEEASRSIQAESNRLGNAWRALKQEMSEGAFSDAIAAGLRGATVALENMNTVLPVATGLLGSYAAIKLGAKASEWMKGLEASKTAMLLEAKAAETSAAATVRKTRIELADAEAMQRKAAIYGGSLAVEAEVIAKTNAHNAALSALAATESRVTAASSQLGLAAKGVLGFFGGPAGLAFMVASTAASWLLFRDNTSSADRALIDFNGTAADAIEKFRELNRQQQAGEILRLQKEMGANYEEIGKAIQSMIGAATNFSDPIKASGFINSTEQLQNQLRAGKLTADQFSDGLETAYKKMIAGSPAATALSGDLTKQTATAASLAVEYQRQATLLGEFTGKQGGAASAAREHAAALDGLGNSAQAAGQKIQQAISTLPGQIERVGKSARQVAALDVRDWFRALQKTGVDFTDQGTAASYIKQGAEYIRLTKDKAAAEKAWNEQQKANKAATREATSDANAQESQYTSIIDRIQRQIALDKEQMGITDDMTAAQKLQVVVNNEMASAKSKLSEEEQKRVRTLLDEAVAQGKALAAQQSAAKATQDALRLQKELNEAARTKDQSNYIDLQGFGRGSDAIEQMRRQLQIQEDYQQRIAALNDRDSSAHYSLESYLKQYQEIQNARDADLAREAEYQEARKAYMADWSLGAARAFEDYAAEAANAAELSNDLFSDAFTGLEDSIVNFVKTGKLSFSDLADSIIEDLARIAAKQAVTGLLKNITGGGGTTGSLADLLGGFLNYDTGGYTGPGGKKQPAGLVHKGEVVWSQRDVARAGGVSVVEALRLGLRGYADGGYVGGGVALSPGGGAHVQVIVENNTNAQAQVSESTGADGTKLIRVLIDQVVGEVDKRIGGMGSTGKVISQRFGMNPKGVTRG